MHGAYWLFRSDPDIPLPIFSLWRPTTASGSIIRSRTATLVPIQAALKCHGSISTYGAVLVLIALSIGLKDRVFPAKDFLLIIVKLAVVVVAVLALRFIDSVINHGFIIRV